MSEEMEHTEREEDLQLVGISGWLVLPAIGFAVAPIGGALGLIIALWRYPDFAAAGYGGLHALGFLVDAGLLVFLIYAAIQFFGRRHNAPSIIVALLFGVVVSSGGLLVIHLVAGAPEFAAESGKQLVRSIIAAAIWIPYFMVSRRVKATFVNWSGEP